MDLIAVSEGAVDAAGIQAEVPGEGQGKSEKQVQEENRFQRAISVWRGIALRFSFRAIPSLLDADYSVTLKGIDLANLAPKLDTTASDIVAHQRDSLVQRKDLAQKTKDFRK